MNRILIFLSILLTGYTSIAQEEIEMADNFRGEGKIYIVLAVILIILFGLFFTLIRIDNKLKRLEKEERKEEV